MKNRKFWVYIIAVIAIVLLNFFEKDGSSAITTLAIALFAANVAQKNEHFNGNNIGE
jgi:cell division protein FtsW (lipid II flippase)